MPENPHRAEKALRTLGERLRESWAESHPVTTEELRAVHDALEEQWAQTQSTEPTQPPGETASPDSLSHSPGQSQTDPAQTQDAQSQDPNDDRDHGHSH